MKREKEFELHLMRSAFVCLFVLFVCLFFVRAREMIHHYSIKCRITEQFNIRGTAGCEDELFV